MSEKACNYCVREFWPAIFVKAKWACRCHPYIESLKILRYTGYTQYCVYRDSMV